VHKLLQIVQIGETFSSTLPRTYCFASVLCVCEAEILGPTLAERMRGKCRNVFVIEFHRMFQNIYKIIT